MKRVVIIMVAVGALSLATVLPSATAASRSANNGTTVPTPTVAGPITTGNGTIVVQSSNFDLATVGYEQAEYFVSGTARSYASTTTLTYPGIVECDAPINAGPHTYVLRAAVAAMHRWVTRGTPPPRSHAVRRRARRHVVGYRSER